MILFRKDKNKLWFNKRHFKLSLKDLSLTPKTEHGKLVMENLFDHKDFIIVIKEKSGYEYKDGKKNIQIISQSPCPLERGEEA